MRRMPGHHAAFWPVVATLALVLGELVSAASVGTSTKAKADAATSLQVCTQPKQCFSVPKYPLKVKTGYDCPPFAEKCTFFSIKEPVANASASRLPAARPVDELQVLRYNKIVASQVAMPLYQFTGEHSTLEAARRLLEAGSTSFKFDLKNIKPDGKPIKALDKRGWLPLLTHGEMPYLTLLDMPFRTFMFWAGRLPPPGRGIEWTDIDGIDVYKEMYRLVVYLLKRYNGSNKTFLIGHWEGDWTIRDKFDKDSNANPKKVQQMIKLLSDKQRAIDNAKRDNPWAKNVFVWHYAEANLVEQSLVRGKSWVSMINTVVPQVKPTLDFVSISVGGSSLREVNPSPALHKALDYCHKQLPPKVGVPEPRVFAGEFYFDMRNRDNTIAIYAPTPELQRQRGCWAAASGVAWGTPYMMWWAFYDTENTKTGGYRGYWLVDNANRATPLFKAYQQYYTDAQEFVRSVIAATGKTPTDYAFRVWATERLIQLSGRTDVARPVVRFWNKTVS